MTDRERYQRAKSIFDEVCDLPADEQRPALDRLCAGDASLREQVEKLLEMDALDIAPLGAAAAGVGAEALAVSMAVEDEPAIPRSIGPYRIVRELGRGGMGVVYEAEQDKPRRTVALKVLREIAVGRQAARRFEREAELLGRLQHPGIAQVYDAGSARAEMDSGRGYEVSYFAMELIRGEPLDAHAARLELDRRQRLEVFARVCDAVQHAHDMGVIHRDLKPDNILVDERSDPKVLDFGIARITDADVQTVTMRTEVGQLIGTVAYMSPEQLAGDPDAIDERTDVYSLGVVLFRLLADRMPFDLANKPIIEVARIVQQDDPTHLSTIDRTLRGDAETIVLTAMEKEPGRRYQTPSALADDIRRFLSDEPLIARPASTAYQLKKFARRNKALVGGVAASFVLLVAGIVGTSIGLVSSLNANTALERTNRELAQTNADLEQIAAFQSAQIGRIDAPAMGVGLRTSILEALPEEKRAELDQLLSPVNFTSRSLEALDEHLLGPSVEVIDEEFADRPGLRGGLLLAVAKTKRDLGLLEQAVDPMERAVDLSIETHGADAERTGAAVSQLANLYFTLGRLEDAEAGFLRGIEILRSADAEHGEELNTARSGLAATLAQLGRLEEAETIQREVLAWRTQHLGAEERSTLVARSNLANGLSRQGRLDEALAMERTTLDLRRRALPPDDPDTISSMRTVSNLLQNTGGLEEAEALSGEAVEASRRSLGDLHPETLSAVNSLAAALDSRGKYEEAEVLYREALAGFERVLGPDNPTTLLATSNLGYVMRALGDTEASELLYRRAVEGLRRAVGDDHPFTLTTIGNLASTLQALGKEEEADPLYVEALEGRRRVLGEDHPSTLNATFNMGNMLRLRGRLDEAEPYAVASLEGYRRVLGEDHVGTQHSLAELGELRVAQGRRDEGIALIREAYESRLRVLGADHPSTVGTLERLEEVESSAGDTE